MAPQPPVTSSAEPLAAPPDRLGAVALPDGRALAWAEWGPAGGRPVLLCPGAATSRALGFGAAAAARLGLRVVSVDRPGLGGSSPAPGRTLASFAEDLAALCRARALGRPAVVGCSQGAPFALACAAAGVASAALVVSGTDELAHPALRPRLAPDVARLVDLAAADPAAAEAFFAGLDAGRMWELILATSHPADRARYAAPDFAPHLRRALEEAFAQGPAGYARDALLAFSRWPFDPAAIGVPVALWYGALDASPVHSPDHGASLAARIPGARRRVVDGEAGALLWTRAGEVLEAAARLG